MQLKKIYKQTWGSYIHLVAGAILTFTVILGVFKLYGLVLNRALMIRSTSGPYFLVKTIIVEGAPYFQFLISVFVTTLFAYIIPAIVIDQRKIFSALGANFKTLLRSPIFTFLVVLIPSLLYVLVLLIRIHFTDNLPAPEWRLGLVILNILVLIFIDAVVYTALSTYYLLQKEN